jgi:hypothetical protein
LSTLLLSSLVIALAVSAHAELRKWTSAKDASKTFEGEMVSAKGDSVVIKRKDGKVLTVPLAVLAQEDRDFVGKASVGLAAGKANEVPAALKESEMAKALNGKTVILEGKTLKKHDIFATKAPKYYLLYWGASW